MPSGFRKTAVLAAYLGLACTVISARAQNVDWPYYGGDQGGMKYSTLTQVDKSNVSKLKLAWQWKTGEKAMPEYGVKPGVFENTPLVVDGVMYVSTGYNKVVALDPVTGAVKWTYDPEAYKLGQPFNGTGFVHRGVALYKDPKTGKSTIFINSRVTLIALDAETGKPVETFGKDGKIDLLKGLRWEIDPKRYSNTSPPVIYKDIIVVGNGVGDRLMYKKDPPGDVRAYDVHTGKQLWSFHTVPQTGEFGADTWKDGSNEYTGHTNVWPPMSLDEKRGLLYMPVTTPSNDFYGARRKGSGLFADSLVCVDIATGKRVWHYQLVHHGLWDYDPPSPPSLITITVKGKKIDAVVQPTKQGFLFTFDRVTGKPVWPIEEKPVEKSTIDGEESWPTQPFPTLPEPIAPQGVSLDDAFDLSPALHDEAVARLKTMKLGPLYTPPSYQGTMMRPGILGGANWGGAAWDPQTHILFIKVNNQAALAKLGIFDKSGPRASEVDSDYVTEGRTNAVFHDGLSILKGPYGFVTAIDMNTGKKLWQIPFGDDAEMRANPALKGLKLPKLLGAVGTQGAIATKAGIVFVGGGDTAFHALDEKDGTDLWSFDTKVRTGGTPMTYMINGKQYVAITVGSGDDTSLMVFTL
ncbi:pyrroloquinoline quinone-dependent dehydrogenase [Terriglobus roseus]|uniref:Quinoprotein glucose dehydrogenase n=1 Tax=Terriglobus roseus TaxID=392734 RepID=A0A1H4JQR2_9BACT|nr:pyrroloquinoline quinone-dependent dehydrogenase [Terriglobus roseus]SEB48650.1 quinoprotein glucose dehydrogenase [Terriglobus roseus]